MLALHTNHKLSLSTVMLYLWAWLWCQICDTWLYW